MCVNRQTLSVVVVLVARRPTSRRLAETAGEMIPCPCEDEGRVPARHLVGKQE